MNFPKHFTAAFSHKSYSGRVHLCVYASVFASELRTVRSDGHNTIYMWIMMIIIIMLVNESPPGDCIILGAEQS